MINDIFDCFFFVVDNDYLSSKSFNGFIWSESEILLVMTTGRRIIRNTELFTDPFVSMEISVSKIVKPYSSIMQ
jgi:hypothetical protein